MDLNYFWPIHDGAGKPMAEASVIELYYYTSVASVQYFHTLISL